MSPAAKDISASVPLASWGFKATELRVVVLEAFMLCRGGIVLAL